jgi:hypothetical protein
MSNKPHKWKLISRQPNSTIYKCEKCRCKRIATRKESHPRSYFCSIEFEIEGVRHSKAPKCVPEEKAPLPNPVNFFPGEEVLIRNTGRVGVIKETPPYHPGDEVVLPNTGVAGIVKSCDMYSGEWCVSVCSDSGMHIVSADKVAPFGKVEKENTASAKNAPVDFDSKKPFEVSDDGVEWFNIKDGIDYDYKFEYITGNNHIVLSYLAGGNRRLVIFPYMRNIPEQFSAGMLEVGEWMVVTEIGPYEDHLITRMDNRNFFDASTHCKIDWDYKGKGRRVTVEIKEK